MGIKVFEFVRRAPGLSIDAFQRRWREELAAEIASSPAARRHLRRYELNHRLAADYARDRHALEVADAGFDGVDVRWLESQADLDAFERDGALADRIARHRAALLAPGALRVVTADPDPIIDKPGRETAEAKLLCILRRNRALAAGPFHAHWKNHHGGLFQRIPELLDPMIAYDQNHGLAADAPFDGVTEQWFADLAAFVESLRAEANVTDVAPDVAYMLDPESIHFIMAGRPTVVLG
jgi:EthD domain